MTANAEVLSFLVGDEWPECGQCYAPMFAVLGQFFAGDTHYYQRFEVECANGHTRVLVGPPIPLNDDMRKILDL